MANKSQLAIEQATIALRAGDRVDAERTLRQRLAEAPDDAEVLSKLAELALDVGRIEDAGVALRRAVVADPSPARRMTFARYLLDHVGAAMALREIEGFPPDLRATVDARSLEAAVLGVLGLHDREIAIYQRMVGELADNPSLWMSLGNALKTVGRMDEAAAALRNAIQARSTYGEAYWTLANFKSFRFTDKDVSAMRRALRQKIGPDDALHLHFALGKALADRESYPQSFKHYAEGNRIRAGSFNRNQMFATRFVDLAIETFNSGFFSRRDGMGCKDKGPIFVIGLQRSGSTLIEQILASHPLIEGLTEITVMNQLWERIVRSAQAKGRDPFQEIAELDAKQLQALGAEYMDRTRAFRRTDRPYFVDKLPANWMNVGLILLALPNAKIIDARRHPMACGFSNFRQHYASGVAFAYSQESIGTLYRDYWRFLANINRVKPGAVHRLINEQLIDDPEGEVRKLLEYVGAPFDPACLEFYENKRPVRTPSAEQVRRPINRDGIDYWKRYEAWLGPMKQALGPALQFWDHVPGRP